MVISQTPERIQKLNAIYLNNEVHQNGWDCYREGRVRLLYHRAYLESQAPTIQLRKAEAESVCLKAMEPVICDGELIVGLPDFSPLTKEEQLEYDALEQAMKGLPPIWTIGGHMTLDFPKLLRVGIDGLLKEIDEYLAKLNFQDPESLTKEEFYLGCKMELEGVLALAEKYALLADEMAKAAEEPRKTELEQIAGIMRRVPRYPARTFWEALESAHFYMFTLHNLFYFGRIDQWLNPYYEADIAAGILTPERAQELLDCFLLIPEGYNGHSSTMGLTIGGRDPQGNLVENDVTKMVLMSCIHCRDCNNLLGYGITKDTSPEFLEFAVRMIQETSEPVLFNDDTTTQGFMNYGMPRSEASQWCNTGCVLTPFAKCSGFGISSYHNMLIPLLEALKQKPENFSSMIDIFQNLLRKDVEEEVHRQNYIMLERGRVGHEVLRISALIDDCLVRGQSLDQGGGKYANLQPNFVGFANVVDSLAVLKNLVYDNSTYTLEEMIAALEHNFIGYETILEQIRQVPRFGMDDPVTNMLAQSVAQIIANSCQEIFNYRGGRVIPGMFSYTWHAIYGAQTPATPDGRKYGMPFANGINPVSGAEIYGPEASIRSETAWDQKLVPVSPSYSILFVPESQGGPGTEQLAAFVRRYFDMGGSMIHLALATIADMKAGLADLSGKGCDFLVSIGAFSVTMKEMERLSPYMKQDMLKRNEHYSIC